VRTSTDAACLVNGARCASHATGDRAPSAAQPWSASHSPATTTINASSRSLAARRPSSSADRVDPIQLPRSADAADLTAAPISSAGDISNMRSILPPQYDSYRSGITERRRSLVLAGFLLVVAGLLTWGVAGHGSQLCVWSVTVGTKMTGYTDVNGPHV